MPDDMRNDPDQLHPLVHDVPHWRQTRQPVTPSDSELSLGAILAMLALLIRVQGS